MAVLPNSSWIATFITQLTIITQNAMKPAFAPRSVVAINSPDPTMDAERMKPGPRKDNFDRNDSGGSLMDVWSGEYLSVSIKFL
jgi:hypothetical protein